VPDQGQPTSAAAPAAPTDPVPLLTAALMLAAPRPTTRVIARWVQRVLAEGGVGKTTTAINLAAAFVEADHECPPVDMDAQGGGATELAEIRRARRSPAAS
jgi:Mrp family chromosome partitioning ATPase